MARVLVGLSGGVDSSVAAALLMGQGHEVVAGYMKNWINEEGVPGDCPWEQDIEDGAAVARVLGIEFRVIDLIEIYRERIVQPLLDGYRGGITPNPDVWCNREVKFGVFLDYALGQGFDAVGTGHYARRMDDESGRASVWRGVDSNKDQSYFLALMTGAQVARALFPVGELRKPEVRELARRHHLPNAGKKDSQGICFIGEVKMADFLSHYLPDDPGEIVDTSGRVLGQHRGLHFYTLGQRRGHGVASPREGMAYVVVGKDFATKRLIVGWDEESTPGLYSSRCVVGSVSDQSGGRLAAGGRFGVQPRYRTRDAPAAVTPVGDGRLEVCFEHPQRAVTPGQICAFYEGERLLGGGVVERVEG